MLKSIINKITFPKDLPYFDYVAEYPDIVFRHEIPDNCTTETIYSALIKNKNSKKLVIYCHGNAETLHFIIPLLQQYSEYFSCNFVSFDYEGCGLSTGKPSEQALINAADLMYEVYSPGMSTVVSWGRSIGSVAATHLGLKYELRTIIESGLSSAYHVAFEKVKTNCCNQFMNIKKISGINDLTIVHGTQDEVVPFANGKTLFQTWVDAHNAQQIFESKNIMDETDMMRCGTCRFYILHGAHHNDIDATYKQQLLGAADTEIMGNSDVLE